MAHKLDNSQANFEKDFTDLLNLRRKLGDNVSEDVAAILQMCAPMATRPCSIMPKNLIILTAMITASLPSA